MGEAKRFRRWVLERVRLCRRRLGVHANSVSYYACDRNRAPTSSQMQQSHVASHRVYDALPCESAPPPCVQLFLPLPPRLRAAAVLSSHVRLLALSPHQILLFFGGLFPCWTPFTCFFLACFFLACFFLGGFFLGGFFLGSFSLSYFLFSGFLFSRLPLSYFLFSYFLFSYFLFSRLLFDYLLPYSRFLTARGFLFRSLLFRFRHNKSPP